MEGAAPDGGLAFSFRGALRRTACMYACRAAASGAERQFYIWKGNISMKRVLAAIVCLLVALTAFAGVSLAEEARVRVGISWVADYPGGDYDEDTQAYMNAVEKAGGEWVYLPCATDEETARAALAEVDCLILTGGEDISPAYYGEEPDALLETVNDVRDVSDFAYAKVALAEDIPTLATCRGFQLVNIACGGSLYQDIPTMYESTIDHRDPAQEDFAYHTIAIEDENSLVAQAMGGAGEYTVNSWHHQGVKTLGEGLTVTAVAQDGMIEAFEKADHRFMLCVQFHPEWHVDDGSDEFLSFFTMLMAA